MEPTTMIRYKWIKGKATSSWQSSLDSLDMYTSDGRIRQVYKIVYQVISW